MQPGARAHELVQHTSAKPTPGSHSSSPSTMPSPQNGPLTPWTASSRQVWDPKALFSAVLLAQFQLPSFELDEELDITQPGPTCCSPKLWPISLREEGESAPVWSCQCRDARSPGRCRTSRGDVMARPLRAQPGRLRKSLLSNGHRNLERRRRGGLGDRTGRSGAAHRVQSGLANGTARKVCATEQDGVV